jgi:ABC-type proline/glycine betaine transport system permease subunit
MADKAGPAHSRDPESMAESPKRRAGTSGPEDANGILAADKLKFFSEHVRGVLTLSSAAVPAVVGVLGLLFRKDAAGNEVLPAIAKSWLILPALAVLSFLISILAGVTYSYYLCQKTDQMEIRVPQLDLASMALHIFFAMGVLLFSAWAFLMIFELR